MRVQCCCFEGKKVIPDYIAVGFPISLRGLMKKSIGAVLTAGALVLALGLSSAAQNKDNLKLQRVQMNMEKHPEIEAAIHHLRQAKQNLEHAAHDFGGHRAKALEHVNRALEECNQALKYHKE
jgi:hypothetical protein